MCWTEILFIAGLRSVIALYLPAVQTGNLQTVIPLTISKFSFQFFCFLYHIQTLILRIKSSAGLGVSLPIYTHFGFMFTHLHILINQCGCVDKVHTDIVCSFLQYQSTVVITMATLSAVPAICFHFEVHFLYMLRKYCFPFRFDEAVHWKAFFLFCCYSSNFIKEFIFLFYCSY